MKKLFAIVSFVTLSSLAYGQAGYVAFFSIAAKRITTNSVGDPFGGSGPVGILQNPIVPSYYYALFVAPVTQPNITTTADPAQNGWTFTGNIATNIIRAAELSIGGDGGALVPGYNFNSTANFAVVGWSANIGSTWAQAESWWNNGDPISNEAPGVYYSFGISTVATNIYLAPDGGPYNDVFGPAAGGLISAMNLDTFIIPEPATFTLAGLGIAILTTFRRRKSS